MFVTMSQNFINLKILSDQKIRMVQEFPSSS